MRVCGPMCIEDCICTSVFHLIMCLCLCVYVCVCVSTRAYVCACVCVYVCVCPRPGCMRKQTFLSEAPLSRDLEQG